MPFSRFDRFFKKYFENHHITVTKGIYNNTIDWEEFAQQLAKYPEIVLSAEVKTNDKNKDTLITDQVNAFQKLNTLISKYK